MLPSIKKALDALWLYLSENEIFVEYDEAKQLYTVDGSARGLEISEHERIEDAMEWALECAKGDY